MFEIYVLNDYEAVSDKAFEVMQATLKAPKVTLGLATGSSPVGLYKRMVTAYQKGQLSMAHVTSYNLDEYVGLDPHHPQSYYTFMFDHLFNHVDINPEHVHLPQGQGSMDSVTQAYESELAQHPQDLQVLGIGSNGHIGFNEPGSSFDSTCHVVKLDEGTRLDNARFFSRLEEVPQYAITMGIQDILRAKQILLIATGANKAKAIYELIHGEVREDVPCTILQKHPKVIVIVDQAAAEYLR